MSGVIKLVKLGKSINSTDPNDFIFHSDYNTLKILDTGLFEPSIPANSATADYTVAHGQDTAPMVMAFMREAALAQVVFSNNRSNVAGSYLSFEGIKTNATNIIFRLANSHSTNAITAHIRYFIFEVPL